jgi:hypothetical protein
LVRNSSALKATLLATFVIITAAAGFSVVIAGIAAAGPVPRFPLD